jgi:hypothetical protein
MVLYRGGNDVHWTWLLRADLRALATRADTVEDDAAEIRVAQALAVPQDDVVAAALLHEALLTTLETYVGA